MLPLNFEKDLDEIIREYVRDVVAGLRQVFTTSLTPIVERIVETIRNGGNIFAFGNGGSHAEADSFLFALEREAPLRFHFGGLGNPNLDMILDTKIEELFGPILRRRGRAGDFAVLVTASGNSLNILNASELSKRLGIVSMSISAAGDLTASKEMRPDYPITIPLTDQQKLEEVTLGGLLIIARQVGLRLADNEEAIDETREKYLTALMPSASKIIQPKLLLHMVEDIISAFKMRAIVRVDATAGVLVSPAQHMTHNLIWDARDQAREVWSNVIISGLLPCHMTGVGNDGGCGYNNAIDVLDNGRRGDVEIVLATTLEDIKTSSLIRAAKDRGIALHSICFGPNEWVAPGLAQLTAHLIGRLTNTRLLVEQDIVDPSKAKEWMRTHDLALLRKKDETRAKLMNKFGN